MSGNGRSWCSSAVRLHGSESLRRRSLPRQSYSASRPLPSKVRANRALRARVESAIRSRSRSARRRGSTQTSFAVSWRRCSTARLGFWRAGPVTFVEDDAPLPGVLQPPDRCESGDERPLGVANRTGAHSQSTGVEYLDVFGLPRERGIRALVVALPPVSYLLRASK